MFFNRNGSGGVEWLLVGLGNPGSKYESTRHNMGWLALDSLMEKEKFALNKLRFKAWTGMLDYKGHKILVMKPQTYMNLSGESVGEAARFYKVPADHVLVISDDVSLPVGKLRIRKRRLRRRSQWAEEHHSAPGHRCLSPHQGGCGDARSPGP